MCRDVDDEADKVSLTEGNIVEDEEVYLVENVHRLYVPSLKMLHQSPDDNNTSRRPSQKAVYMAETPMRNRKDNVGQS
jgi:hypothetical protein